MFGKAVIMVDVGRDGIRSGAPDDGLRPDPAREARSRIEREAARHSGRLALAGLGLSQLPAGVLELSWLRELDLAGNRLEQLPERLAELTGLERLVLRGNRLAGLPPSLSELTRLKHLDLADNQFAEIPRWLGRLELESIHLGDGADLVHPPAEVVARGTQAVLAYLRERDGVGSVHIDGGALTRRSRPASADIPIASDGPAQIPADPSAEPAREVWHARRRSRVLMLGAGALLLLAVIAIALPRMGGASRPSASGALGNPGGSGGGTNRVSPPDAAVSLTATPSGAPGNSEASASASTGTPGASQSAVATVIASASAGWSTSFVPSPMVSVPIVNVPIVNAPLVGPILSGNTGGGALCAVYVTGHGANPDQIDVTVCASANAPSWIFEPAGDTLQTSGLCMSVMDDGATSSGSNVVLNACDAGPEQVFVPQSGGWLYNPGSGLCVSEVSGKKHQQAAVSMELCGAAGQQWNLPT